MAPIKDCSFNVSFHAPVTAFGVVFVDVGNDVSGVTFFGRDGEIGSLRARRNPGGNSFVGGLCEDGIEKVVVKLGDVSLSRFAFRYEKVEQVRRELGDLVVVDDMMFG